MKKSTQEWLTGIAIGIILSLLLAVKVFAAPVSAEDAELIARAVQAESGNQCLEGRRYVAAVIINRVDSPEFPDTVEDVLSEDGQFSTYSQLSTTEATWQDRLATKMEIESRSDTDIVFFRAGHYGCGQPAFQCGDHYFSTIK